MTDNRRDCEIIGCANILIQAIKVVEPLPFILSSNSCQIFLVKSAPTYTNQAVAG